MTSFVCWALYQLSKVSKPISGTNMELSGSKQTYSWYNISVYSLQKYYKDRSLWDQKFSFLQKFFFFFSLKLLTFSRNWSKIFWIPQILIFQGSIIYFQNIFTFTATIFLKVCHRMENFQLFFFFFACGCVWNLTG